MELFPCKYWSLSTSIDASNTYIINAQTYDWLQNDIIQIYKYSWKLFFSISSFPFLSPIYISKKNKQIIYYLVKATLD